MSRPPGDDDPGLRDPAVRRCSSLALLLTCLLALGWTAGRVPIDGALAAEPAHRLDLNAATDAELTLLPTIGPKRAAAIVGNREARGPFASLDDLQRVHGVGPRTVLRLAPYAHAPPPPGADRP